MANCKYCFSEITSKYGKIFCSKSCSASFSNQTRDKSYLIKQRESLMITLSKKPKLTKKVKVEKVKSKLFLSYCEILLDDKENLLNNEEKDNLLKNKIYNLLFENKLSPNQIKEKYKLQGCFRSFIRNRYQLTKSLSQSMKDIRNKQKKNDKNLNLTKSQYYRKCIFRIPKNDYNKIENYHLLLQYGTYHPIKNPNGVSKDHKVSRIFGYLNNIDPYLISHICNCQFLQQKDNAIKESKCSITVEELVNKIQLYDK